MDFIQKSFKYIYKQTINRIPMAIGDNIPSFDERMENFLSWKDHCPNYFSRGVELDPNNNVCVVKSTFDGVDLVGKDWMYGANLVTNDGDIYYAKQSCEEAHGSNEDFSDSTARIELQNPSSADTPAKGDAYQQVSNPVTASRKAFDSNYPKTADADSDNTGAGVDVVTYLTSWTTSDFNATGIKGGAIHENASPVNATKLLTHFTISSFDKTSSDTLKVFVNHTMNGS